LNERFPWEGTTVQRVILQALFTVMVGLIIGFLITSFSHFLNPYSEDLIRIYVFNMIVVAVCNIVLMTIFEAWIFFYRQSESEKRNLELSRELSSIRFEVLKNQMNPHFMFNSLNVLSSLIEEDTEKSQRFIEEFSSIYRYVLETIEKHVVTLERELEFARSYMFLQQIRHGQELTWSVEIPSDWLQSYLPPLSLQFVLENAIKHNKIENGNPFHITIDVHDGQLIVINPLKPKISFKKSTGVGQTNLKKRYSMVTNTEPEFILETDRYVVSLPLIREDYAEHSNR
jgi:sensor histidine kinase YesM